MHVLKARYSQTSNILVKYNAFISTGKRFQLREYHVTPLKKNLISRNLFMLKYHLQ